MALDIAGMCRNKKIVGIACGLISWDGRPNFKESMSPALQSFACIILRVGGGGGGGGGGVGGNKVNSESLLLSC